MTVADSPHRHHPLLRLARPCLVVYWITLIVFTHLSESQMPQGDMFNFGQLSIDKVIHFTIFVGLTVLLFGSAPIGRSRGRTKNLIAACAIALAYGVIDEITQDYFDRTSSIYDLAADWGGVFAVFVAGMLSPAWLRESGDTSRESGRFVGHAMLVSALTFLSRITGLLRDSVLASIFGLKSITDAFYLAFIIPNLFRRLFGEGALTAALIPVYTELLKTDRAAAGRLATLCTVLLFMLLAALTLVGELVLWWLLGSRDWSGDSTLALQLTMLMLPYMPLVCLVALIGGLLQVHGRFGPAAFAPILLNVIVIAATLIVGLGLSGDIELRGVVFYVAGGVLLAGVCQLVWVVAAVLRYDAYALGVSGAMPAMKSVMVTMAPMIVGLAVFQINTLFDGLIAWFLSPKDGATSLLLFGREMAAPIQTGSVTALQFAQRLYQFPVGVFGVAIATAIFPALSHAAANDDSDSFATTVRHGLRLTVFIGLPASVGLIVVRDPLVRLLFERGEFDATSTTRVASILIGYASAVWAYSMTHVITRAFYAMKDAKTPLRVAVVMVILNLALNLTLVWWLGAAGLAWSTAICAAIQSALLVKLLGRRVDHPVDASVWSGWRRTLMLSVVMGIIIAPVNFVIDTSSMSALASALVLLGQVAIGAIVFLIGAKVTKSDELTWLLKRKAV